MPAAVSGSKGAYLQRARFIAISEFGPYSFIYHEGRAYRVYKAKLAPGVRTPEGGRLLMTNTAGQVKDRLHRPWILRTYRDLFVNVGNVLESEERFPGEKDGVSLEALICLYRKPAGAEPVAL